PAVVGRSATIAFMNASGKNVQDPPNAVRMPAHLMNALRRLLTAALLTGPLPASAQDSYLDQRQRLVDQIVVEMQATSRDTGRDKLRDSVLRAMRTVPRHRFVPPELAAEAYRDRPLPIGLGQTISQPFI